MDAWCKLVNTRYINGFLSQKVYYVAKSIHQLTPLNRIWHSHDSRPRVKIRGTVMLRINNN